MVECRHCGEFFANNYQLGPHIRVCASNNFSDSGSSFTQEASSSDSSDADSSTSSSKTAAPAEVPEHSPAPARALFKLAQRSINTPGVVTPVRHPNPLRHQHDPARTHDYMFLQKRWSTYVSAVHQLASKEFWRLFKVINGEKGTCADNVLKYTKKLLQAQPQVSPVHLCVHSFATLSATLRSQ